MSMRTVIATRGNKGRLLVARVIDARVESFNDLGEGGGCHKIVPDLEGNGTKIIYPGDIFDQTCGEIS